MQGPSVLLIMFSALLVAPALAQPAATLFAPGVVSTEAPEFAISFSPDGREVYFNRASADRGSLSIMTARRQPASGWSTPVVASFSGTFRDVDPFVSPDGRRLYFSSDRPRRPGGARRFATWYVERRGEAWGPPVDPGPPLNSEAGDVFVSVSRDGTMLFSSTRDGASRVYQSREVNGRWLPPSLVRFGDVEDAGNPLIAPSGRFALIVRAPAGGAADLHVSCRVDGGWATPIALGAAVNSAQADFAPALSADERTLFFTSERPGVTGAPLDGARPPGDLYQIDSAAAGIQCR